MFKHTRVDIEDDKKVAAEKVEIGVSKFNSRMHEATKSFGILGGDIFCFYKLCVDLPASFYSELGETALVTYKQECEIKEFLQQKYP